MKKLIKNWVLWIMVMLGLLLLFSIGLNVKHAFAEEWWERISLEARPMLVIGSGEDNQSSELGYGGEFRAKARLGDIDVSDDFSVRFELGPWVSYDTRNLRLFGQRGGKLDLLGIGPGLYISFLKYISLRAEVGYYFPFEGGVAKGERTVSTGGEGQKLYWDHWINSTGFFIPASEFKSYERKFKGDIGGTAGVNFHYDVTDHWRVGLDLGYRILWIQEYRKAYLPVGWDGCASRCNIETKQEHFYGGLVVGLTVTYTF